MEIQGIKEVKIHDIWDRTKINKPLKVVIEVLGGVATVTRCPSNVDIEIIDHDES